jgi:HAD superfamily hydrolase (TIGR01509 family)
VPDQPSAVVFDLDGVIADTEPIYFEGLRRFLAPDVLTYQQYESLIGISWSDTWRWVQQHYGREERVEELHAASRPFLDAALEAAVVEPLIGLVELIGLLRGGGIRLGVASQSSPRWVTRVLDATGLTSTFDVVVTASEVKAPKPAPDIYLRASSLLGVPPPACIAVEDSPAGIASAHAAGMTVVQLRQTRPVPPHELAAFVVDEHQSFPLHLLGLQMPPRPRPASGDLPTTAEVNPSRQIGRGRA